MSKDELKNEINKVLDLLPDEALGELLEFLNKLGRKGTLSILDEDEFAKLLMEDEELLTRLAQ
jgi:hypothetical protein